MKIGYTDNYQPKLDQNRIHSVINVLFAIGISRMDYILSEETQFNSKGMLENYV